MAAVLLASVAVGLYTMLSGRGHDEVSDAGFDLSSIAARPPAAAVPAVSEEPVPRSSPAPVVGGLASDPAVTIGGRPAGSASSGAPASSAAPRAAEKDPRAKEADFLARHGAELKRYHERIGRVAERYRRTHPIVREVDMAFLGMPRYMEVKIRFDKNRDPYSFARDSLALPEVRAEISKRLKQPEVWTAALGMITSALKESPPPKHLYDEGLAFLGREQAVADHVMKFTEEAAAQAPVIATALPQGADLAPLQKLVTDVGAATNKR